MNYKKIYTSPTEYVIREVENRRNVAENQPDYLAWLAAGNLSEVVAYTPPPPARPPTLEEAKAAKREELKRTRDEIIGAGFSFGGHTFPLAEDVKLAMMMEFQAAQVAPAPSYAWKDVGGIYRQIGGAAAFQGFCMAAMAYGKELYAREEALQAAVNAAATVEEAEAVIWQGPR